MSNLIDREALCEFCLNTKDRTVDANDIMRFPSVEPERTAKVTLLNTGLHSVWGICECGRQVEKPGRNDQSGAYWSGNEKRIVFDG